MEQPDMIRYQLNIVPEVLPLVWPELREPIQAAFAEMPADGEPCRRYLFRLARSLGIELFKNDESKRFWEDKCDTVIPWENKQTINDVFPLAEELNGGYLPPKEIRPKIYQALHAIGKAARRFLDDPDINPNIDLSWNWPFFVWLGYYADWKTYKGWLLRGMEIYRDNMDDPGDFELGSTPSIVRHLLPDLEHRPWISKHYTGNTLGYVAADGDISAVKQILKEGCPVNFHRGVAGDKISPLRAALLHDRDAVARLLYAAGGMNIQNGVVYPVPPWIAKPRPFHVARIRKTLGDANATPILIDPITPLPPRLSKLREHWLEDAKELNGNCCCMIPCAPDAILFRYDGRLYALCRESVAMDWHAFEVSFDEICRDLKKIGVICHEWTDQP
jgi:hypothetical protein